MSIRTQGRQLAASVTVIVGVVSIAVTSIVSFALWRDTARSTTSVGPGGTSNSDDSSQSGFSNDGSGQQFAPVSPGQGFGNHAQSSGS
ncbi:MAG TPA: hypothetical protein DCP11_11465 [Microbacteriaceae bacterium]|jgi:uncharacterized membrane protein|nr:hypothetical protein [Microbacteriaceae bacterium]